MLWRQPSCATRNGFALSARRIKRTGGRERISVVAETKCEVIEGLEREWRDALCSRDMERLKSLVHKDLVLFGPGSTGPFMMTGDECLEAIRRRAGFGLA